MAALWSLGLCSSQQMPLIPINFLHLFFSLSQSPRMPFLFSLQSQFRRGWNSCYAMFGMEGYYHSSIIYWCMNSTFIPKFRGSGEFVDGKAKQILSTIQAKHLVQSDLELQSNSESIFHSQNKSDLTNRHQLIVVLSVDFIDFHDHQPTRGWEKQERGEQSLVSLQGLWDRVSNNCLGLYPAAKDSGPYSQLHKGERRPERQTWLTQ